MKSFFLAGMAAILVVGPGFEWAQQPSMDPQFEAASVKPAAPDAQRSIFGCHGIDFSPPTQVPLGRCIFRNQTASIMIREAYPLPLRYWNGSQVIGGPGWVDSSLFAVDAEAENPTSTTVDQLHQMLRTLLKEQFKLASHIETRDIAGYAMVQSKDGFKLQPAEAALTRPPARAPGDRSLFANYQTLDDYAGMLSLMSKMTIVNKTGISGRFNITLNAAEVGGGDIAPSIFTALPEQLGLRLEAQKIPFQFIVIDHIDKPQQ